MGISYELYAIFALFIFTFLINLPFGYFRSKTIKYSLPWFLYIHIPIPLILVARTFSHIEFRYVPIFVLAALAGQILGGKFNL
jgi:hypothetical protein